MSDELAKLDATAQAELVRRGEVLPLELVQAAIERIERLNPKLNAVIHRSFERAMAQARSGPPDGPFRGVPFLLKDLGGGNLAGDPIHWGTRVLKEANYRATTTSHLVNKFRAAGLVIVGRTNVPELGAWSTTEPAAYGPTRNPWNPERSSGGSSGGAAAATAAGIVPFAHASDGGGSIRNPSSQCGLIGLKPSRGRISLGPDVGEFWAGMVFEFAVTRTVRDTAALLDCVQGPMPGDPYSATPPGRPYREEVGTPPGRLRIGLMDSYPGHEVHPDCSEAVRAAGRLLERLGHNVEVSHPAALVEMDTMQSVLKVIPASQAREVEWLGQAVGREIRPDDLDSDNWLVSESGKGVSATQYLRALEDYNHFSRAMSSWWAGGFDILITPTITRPSPRIGEFVPDPAKPLDAFTRSGAILAFCIPFNITGQPAVSLPLHWNGEGLPIGVQCVAAMGREDLLFRLAAQLEGEIGWSERRPPIHAAA